MKFLGYATLKSKGVFCIFTLLIATLILAACGDATATPVATTAAAAATTTAAMTTTAAAMTTATTGTGAMTTTAAGAATPGSGPLVIPPGDGTEPEKTDLVMALVPSRQSDVIQTQADNIANFLSKETGYRIKATVLTSYGAVGEGMNAKNIDFAWVGPLDFVVAANKFGVYPITGSVRKNTLGYKAFIIARSDSGINSLADLKGKNIILGDPLSASSNLYPAYALQQAGLKPGVDVTVRNITSQSAIAIGVEEKAGDAGAFYDDARTNKEVTDKYPNVLKDTKIIYTTPLIPADPQIVRKDLNANEVKKLQAAMLKLSGDAQGKKYLNDLFTIDGLATVKDSDYDGLRDVVKAVKPDLLAK